MAICRSGAYLRRSPMACCSGGRFEGRRWASDKTNPQKEWVSDGHSRFGDFCATMFLCLAARYRLSSTRYPRREKCD